MRRLWTVLLGVLLLAWGLSLLGLPVFSWPAGLWDWLLRLWPMVLVILGASTVVQGWRSPRGRGLVWGMALAVLGVAWLGNNLRVWPEVSLLAALLIGGGVGFLLRALRL